MVENLGVLSSESIFLDLVSLREAGQGINSSITFSLALVDPKVIPGEFLGPTDLPGTQVLGIHESAEIVVVGEDENLIFAAFQIVAPILEGLNDSQ